MIQSHSRLRTLIMYFLLMLVLAISIIPFLWMLSTAFKSPFENLFAFPHQLIP